ncbi:HK97 family phage prohead protease [Streptomyces sp. NPDC054940]
MSALTMQAAPRDGLLRSVPFELLRAEDDESGDGLSLEGYAAVWDAATEIDSWEGSFTEKIRRGAFRKTIRENTPVLQFDHGRHPLVGSIPIGAIEQLSEDDSGLYVRARLSDNWLIQPVRDAIAERSIKGMSFRFSVIREEWRDNAGKLVKPDELGRLLWDPGDRGPLERTLIEVRCPELGPVVFPAYTQTSVDVRARGLADDITRDAQSVREVRRSLATDAAALRDRLNDPQLRAQVARALLFNSEAAPEGEPAPAVTATPPEDGHLADRTATPGAPLTTEHPPSVSDAPLATEHPSPSPRGSRLRDQIQEITGLMDDTLARIAQRQTTDGAQSLAGGNPPEGHQGRA